MHKLLVATGNAGKMIELRALLSSLAVELATPDDLGLAIEVSEDGATYVQNAVKKASAFAAASGLVSLADDTGLEVLALDGAPGLHSKRYMPGEDATDADRRAFLLRNLRGQPRPWLARFCAAVAVASPGGQRSWTEGECQGEIIPDERGSSGFGYDSLFLVASAGRTMAELDLATKNRVSHRGQAVMKVLPVLLELLG